MVKFIALALGSSTPLGITGDSFIISNNNFSGDSADSTGPAFIINGNGNSIQGNNWTNFDDNGIVNANGNIIIGNMIAGTGPIVDSG